MPDLERDPERPERPVADGLIALVGVAVIVGLILGIGALLASKIAGLGGDSGGSGGDTVAQDSLYLPHPQPTDTASGPLVTLAPNKSRSRAATATAPASPKATKSEKAKKEAISLSAGQTQVSPMEEIDLYGTYPGGEGAILEVQELERGQWTPFDASMSVTGGVFSSYIYTGIEGKHTYRVIDNETGETSNQVIVEVR